MVFLLKKGDITTMEERICNLTQLKKLYDNEPEGTAALIAGLLQDEDVKTTDMFECLAYAYIKGSDEFRRGMDKAMTILLWKNMQDVANEVMELIDEEEEGKE